MKKFLKVFIWVLVVLVVAVVIAAVVFIKNFDPNRYKTELSTMVKQKTGLDLTIKGAINISIFPWLGLETHDVTLSNPPAFGVKNMAEIGEAQVKIKLLPLIAGELHIKNITLKNATINLMKLSSGATNWQALMDSPSTPEQKTATPQTQQQAADSSSGYHLDLNSLAISSLDINNTQVNWIDKSTGKTINLTQLNFASQDISLNRFFPVNLSFSITQNKPPISLNLKANSDIKIDLGDNHYQLTSLELSGVLTQSKQTIPFSFAGNVDLNDAKQSAALKNFILKIMNASAEGDLSVENYKVSPTVAGSLEIPTFDTSKLIPLLPATSVNYPRSFGLSTKFTASASAANLAKLTLTLDQTKLTGTLKYQHDDQYRVNFSLNGNAVNLDNYIKTSSANGSTSSNNAGGSSNNGRTPWSRDPVLPMSIVKNLDLEGTVQLTQVAYNQVALNDIKAQVATKNHVISLNPLSANLASGTISASAQLNAASNTPAIAATLNVANVDITQIIKLFTNHVFLKGQAQYTTSINMVGNSLYDWVNSLSGKGVFKVNNGAVQGVDFFYLGQAGEALLNKKSPQGKNTSSTPFSAFGGTYTINQGVVSNQDLTIASGNFSVTGKGTANLPQQSINYSALINFGSNVQIPVYIRGYLFDPDSGVDMGLLLQNTVKKTTQALQKNVGDQLKNAVNNIFSGKKVNLPF